MVGPASPLLVKTGTLAFRYITKPLGDVIKGNAARSPLVRRFVITYAQSWHRFTHKVNRRFLGLEKKDVKPLNEKAAVDKGSRFIAHVLGETFVFLTVVAMYWVYDLYNTERENEKQAKVKAYQDGVSQLIEEQRNEILQLRRDILRLQLAMLKESQQSEVKTARSWFFFW